VYQVKFTPAAGFEGDATVSVKAGSFTDAAGNAGEAGSLSGLHVDTLAPTVQITASDLALVAGQTSVLTFTFSNAPQGFSVTDIAAKHGAVRDLHVTSNPLVYAAVFVPEAAYVGGVGVSLVKGAYTDAFGNEGSAAALTGMSISNHVLSQLNFEVTPTWGFTEVLAPGGGVWHTDNAKNMVEIGTERVYGSPRWWLKNHVIELADNPGDASNLYTEFSAASGTQLKLSFDYSARSDASQSAFEVVWGGKVIDTIDPGKPFGWKHADYTLDVLSTGVQGLELRAVDKSSYGAVLDNVTLSATQVSAPSAGNKSVIMSTLDFQSEYYWLYSFHNMKMADNKGWFSDNPLGFVELGRETRYGGKNADNRVIELADNVGDVSNLYTNLLFEQGSHFQFTFDISARQGQDSRVNVLWDGKVIDAIDPGREFGWQTHTYDLVANGDMQRLELQAVNHNAFGAVLDNLTLASHAVV
jgi:Bacterial Ig-like domain